MLYIFNSIPRFTLAHLCHSANFKLSLPSSSSHSSLSSHSSFPSLPIHSFRSVSFHPTPPSLSSVSQFSPPPLGSLLSPKLSRSSPESSTLSIRCSEQFIGFSAFSSENHLHLHFLGKHYSVRANSGNGNGDSDDESDKGAGNGGYPSRLIQKRQLLDEKTQQFSAIDIEPIPTITEEHVTVTFARSGGPGGQNVNKVNTKVDMRFNVMNAAWLPERIKLKLLEREKNRINSDGELVVSSTKTRTQKDNIKDALEKIQAMIDAAGYVPPPPSEEKKKRIARLAKAENKKRLESKKKLSNKKSDRRSKGSWD